MPISPLSRPTGLYRPPSSPTLLGNVRFGQLEIGTGHKTQNTQIKLSVWESIGQSFHLFFDGFKQFWADIRKKTWRDQAELLGKRLSRSLAVLWDGSVFTGSILMAWVISPFCAMSEKLQNNVVFKNIERAYLYKPVRYNDTAFITDKELANRVFGVTVFSKDKTKLDAWYFAPQPNRPVILLAHGRNTNIQTCEPIIKAFLNKGYGVFALDYRGFGDSKGSPSEAKVYEDLMAASNDLAKNFKMPAETSQILVGHSLGGAIAADVAARRNFKAVVLASTFPKLDDEMTYLKHHRNGGSVFYKTMLPDWLLKMTIKSKFDTASKIPKIQGPLFFVHGDQDPDVNPDFCKKLFSLSTSDNKEKALLKGARHDLLCETDDAQKLANAVDDFLKAKHVDKVS